MDGGDNPVKQLLLLTSFLFALIPCSAQIALVNSTAMPSAVLATGGRVTTTAVSMTGATSIWCGITYGKSTNSFAVSDSKSNTWHATTAANSKSGMGVQWFYTYGPTTSSSQTFTLTSTGSTTRGAIACYGLSGTLTTSGVLDPSAPAGLASTSSGGTTIQPGSLTPAQPGEAFLTVAGNNNIGYTYTISSPFNTPVNGSSSWNGAVSYYISTGTSAENPTWTVSSHDFLAASMVAVQPSQSSGGTCPASVPVPPVTGCSYNLYFGSQTVGSTSSAQTLSFSISAGTVVGSIAVLTTGIASKDFANAAGSTCTASTYTTGTNCVVNVSLTPLAPGPRRGAVVFYSGANNTGAVLATVPVYGVGNGPQLAYGPGGAQTILGSGFSSPAGVAVDAAGNVFIADATAAVVERATPGGTEITVGGGFSKPVGVAVDGAGNLYVADSKAAVVYQAAPGGTETTVGSGFIEPAGVAVDGAGNVYVVDPGVPGVYKVTPGGTETTVGSGFIEPAGVAVDAAGNVYVVDPGVPGVYKVTPGGTQTKIGSGFSKPMGVAVDAAGNVYIVDAGTGVLYEVTPGGTETTVGSGFEGPAGVAVDGAGNLYVADTGRIRVVKIDRADAPSLSFAPTNVGSTSTDSPKTVEVQNIGNLGLTLTGLSYPADFPEAIGDNSACTSLTSLSPAEQCDLPIDFTPQSEASLSEEVTLTDNALNVTGATQSIAVSGTGTSGLTTQTITFTPPTSPVAFGVPPITLNATGGASGNPVTFTVVSGPGSITGNTLTITGAGTVVVAANQAGNANYAAAAQVTQSIVVNHAPQTITFTPPTSPVTLRSLAGYAERDRRSVG